jgi:hypothetical protein
MSKGLPGICGGWPLAVLMLRVGKTGGLGPSAAYVSGCGEPFYGTRVDPGWYQTGTSVPRVRNPPFSLLRGLIQLRLAGWDDGPFGKSYYKVGQAFEPAGWRGLPAPREHPNDWKVAGTCRQESLPCSAGCHSESSRYRFRRAGEEPPAGRLDGTVRGIEPKWPGLACPESLFNTLDQPP